jgi:hypothetical protein
MPADAPVMSATGRAEVAMLIHPFSRYLPGTVAFRMRRVAVPPRLTARIGLERDSQSFSAINRHVYLVRVPDRSLR